jgi:nitrogen fixation protein NifB
VPAVAETAGRLGVDILNLLPLYPVEGSAFEDRPEPGAESMGRLRLAASEHVAQMHHCTRCRADATGLLGEGAGAGVDLLRACARMPLEPGDDRPRVAVGTIEGVLVNQHLGEAATLWVFEPGDEGVRLVERRQTPAPGGGGERWRALAGQLADCSAVLVSGAGAQPIAELAACGVEVIVTEGVIEDVLERRFAGEPLPPPRRETVCGAACSGTGEGCG